jgi:hypothetical protein
MKKVLLLLLLVSAPTFAEIVTVDDEVCRVVDKQLDMQAQYMSLPGTTTVDYMYILDLTGQSHHRNGRKPDYLATVISKVLALKTSEYINNETPLAKIKPIINGVCNGLKGRVYEIDFSKD